MLDAAAIVSAVGVIDMMSRSSEGIAVIHVKSIRIGEYALRRCILQVYKFAH